MFSKTTLATIAASALSLSTLFVAPLTQAAQVFVPDDLQILSVDGHSGDQSNNTLQLNQGSHVLVVQYRDLFSGVTAEDSATWVKSQPLYLQFSVDTKDVALTTPTLDDVADAQTYLKHPYLDIYTNKDNSRRLALQPAADVIADLLSAKR
ncbi:DUF2057 family protein [Shewanella dokdonensis]|uniref:DUF2057 family protein n=1 Tax=Shewanella dokdonensis TaxID=712036 RepID=UPI00200C9EBA|nr:DUF2057 family protein [Shewanella dokdonensis]MCL1074451.1 DUF2057 domain-containing protein [Shewanella dokdonensis]